MKTETPRASALVIPRCSLAGCPAYEMGEDGTLRPVSPSNLEGMTCVLLAGHVAPAYSLASAPAQRRLLDYVVEHWRVHRRSPTIQTCARALGRYVNAVREAIQRLVRKGFLTHEYPSVTTLQAKRYFVMDGEEVTRGQ